MKKEKIIKIKLQRDYPLVTSHKKRKKKWIIVCIEGHGPKVNEKFDTKEQAEEWLDSWAIEWREAAEDVWNVVQDPRDYYGIMLED